jgi:two-component sensor histidine kinase
MVLRRAAEALSNKDLDVIAHSPAEWSRVAALARDLPRDIAMWVYDDKGDLKFTSYEFAIRSGNFADREYFRAHRNGADFHVGRSYLGGLFGQRVFSVSRRLEREGAFAGVVLVAIHAENYARWEVEQSLPPRSMFGILRLDGHLLVRQPPVDIEGALPTATQMISRIDDSPATQRWTSGIDGEERIMSLMRVPGFPMVAKIGLSVDEALKPWQERTARTATVAGIALLTLWAMAWFALRSVRREAKSLSVLEIRSRELAEALDARNVLLRELHHRVKNNLQLVASLLGMAERTAIADAKPVLREARQRIRTIGFVHEHLHKSNKPDQVDCADYLRKVGEAVASAGGKPARVALDFQMDPVVLPIDMAQPLAIIFNEVLTNSLKHAFKDRLQGRVMVQLCRQDDGQILLAVSDDGVGLAARTSRAGTSLGLQIIGHLARQIGAVYSLHSNGGTHFRLTVPPPGVVAPRARVAG